MADPLPNDRKLLTISELTNQLKDFLQSRFSAVWVAGEIADLARPPSGHVYMTLKDGNAQLKAVMWRNAAERLKFPIEDGMEVLCHGEIDIYPPRGTYQLIIRKMELRGEGAAQRALKALQQKLRREGLFDPVHKKPLPLFPKQVAVVTSPTGAAVRDFLEVARRRWSGAQICVIPARVQGAESAAEVVRGIRLANQASLDFDLLVVTRGGGSMEDLQSFNDEAVCRAIFASRLPVISAVGHEIDVTLSDLVADVRALTPSEAAERAVPSADEIRSGLDHLGGRLLNVLQSRFDRAKLRLDQLANSRVLRKPEHQLLELARRLDELQMRADRAANQNIQIAAQSVRRFAAQLESLSPLGVLGRGYSITQLADRKGKGRSVITHAGQVQVGDSLITKLAEGEVTSRVESVDEVRQT